MSASIGALHGAGSTPPAAGFEPWSPRSDGLPVSVMAEEGSITARRRADGAPIHYLTFEREGSEMAYGVYGLAGAKNAIPVPRPLRGDPITWVGLDAAAALTRLLRLAGLSEPAAREFVSEQNDVLFSPGLRVHFVLGAGDLAIVDDPTPEDEARVILLTLDVFEF